MESIALIIRIIVLSLMLNVFFVPLVRRLWTSFGFTRAYFLAFIVSLIPTAIIGDLLARIPSIGTFLGFMIWDPVLPLFAGPAWKVVPGAMIFVISVLLLMYTFFAGAIRILQLQPEHGFRVSLALYGAYWLTMTALNGALGWAGLPQPYQVGFSSFFDTLTPLTTAIGQVGILAYALGALSWIALLLVPWMAIGMAQIGLAGQPARTDRAVARSDGVAMITGLATGWGLLFAFPIASLGIHALGALLLAWLCMVLGDALGEANVRQRPRRTLALCLILTVALLASIGLVLAWAPFQANVLLAAELWLAAPYSAYSQYALWPLAGLVLTQHWARLLRARPKRRGVGSPGTELEFAL